MKVFRKVSIFSFVAVFVLLFLVIGLSAISVSAYSPNLSGNHVMVLAKHQDEALAMYVSGGYVYWYVGLSGQLNRVNESGGKVQTIATVDYRLGYIWGLAVQGNFVYYIFCCGENEGSSYLYKTNISSGETTTLFQSGGNTFGGGVAVNGNEIYFATEGVYKIRTDGSDLVGLSGAFGSAMDIAYSRGTVYFTDFATGQVAAVPASGGNTTWLSPEVVNGSTGMIGIHSLIVVGDYLYWTVDPNLNGTSYVLSVQTDGVGFKALHTFSDNSSDNFLTGISFWNQSVIFVDHSTYIYSVPSSGGRITPVVKLSANDCFVSGGFLYFTTGTEVAKAQL